ncbi:hypothetical protein [Planomonospora parontospora]|uniref:hypothetical protein n=1 Tax=Planomonospora parontospora TaxID=58119 RepID=UPI00167054D4|nr:hypothetical protein [Planomonospora parontospora]GGL51537.1 hypothetical protein GCM10014719_61040 [Planomonospora parontospora subsp. antibiotica]GII20212.1 hypothetical protein Ppa05_69380 [Planomonospora parontospora subsp. antibiotica]
MEYPRDDQDGYVPSLHEHLQLTGSEDRVFSFEEVIAVRIRLTGDDFSGRLQDTQARDVIDRAKLSTYIAALAAQDLQRGDVGPAFLALLGYTQGSIPQARERMMTAFGRAPSRSYAAKLHKAWQEATEARRASGTRKPVLSAGGSGGVELDQPRR